MAQESSIQDTVSIEKQSAHKWYNYLWQHLQFTKNIGYNMYGDNVVNSCINRLGHNDSSYAMNGFKFSFEIKYNVFERNHLNLYTGVGCALYSQKFKSDYVYFKDNGSVWTFIHTSNPAYIANAEAKQPMDFGLEHKDWDSSFSTIGDFYKLKYWQSFNYIDIFVVFVRSLKNIWNIRREVE